MHVNMIKCALHESKLSTLISYPKYLKILYIYSRIFENVPQDAPEYSHRKLAIASFLVTALRENIGGLLCLLYTSPSPRD